MRLMMLRTRWEAPPWVVVLLAAALLSGCGSSFWVPPPPSPAEIPGLEARLAVDPEDAPTAVRLAHAYWEVDRLDEARALLERTVRLHPDQPLAAFLLGVTYEESGMYAEARTLYRTYLDHGASPRLREELSRRLPLLQRRQLEAEVRAALTREAELADTPPVPWTVAVMPFHFIGEDPRLGPLGRALAEMLVTDLSQTDRLRVLERTQIQYLLDEMGLADAGLADPSTAARAGRILGAERAVHGSMDGGEPSLRLETAIVRISGIPWPGERATDTDRPDLLRLSETDALARIFDMQERLALRIYASLGIELTPTERERVTRRRTENLMAILAYGRGLEAEDAGNFAAAVGHFAEATALDPDFEEAREAEARASALLAASQTPPRRLASLLDEELLTARPFRIEPFFPTPLLRDSAAEILGAEGIGPGTFFEFIFRER